MKPNYYAILPAEVRYSEDLAPNSKLLYAEISALTNKSGKCFAQNSYFAKLYNVEKETVSRWISQLEKFGFIKTKVIRNKNKQVEKRYIYVNTYKQNKAYPINKNVKDNIYTNINIINNNSSHVYNEQVLKAFDYIVPLFPERNRPKNEYQKKQWLDVIRLCNSEDKVNPRQLYYLLDKVRKDEFWSDNFLSLLSLRKSKNGVRKLDRFLQKFADKDFNEITK
jgi:DNA-binding PadR family transcriptional regulator